MSAKRTDTELLVDEIAKTRQVLLRVDAQYRDFLATDFVTLGRKHAAAVVIAEMLVSYYTCIETLFVRISQHFENSLRPEKWHTDLLHKMTIDVEGVRMAAISDQTHALLSELLRFRHFKRYYFDIQYDWDKIEYLQKKYDEVRPLVEADLNRFTGFLRELTRS